MTGAMEKSLNGTYTHMLRKAQNVHWSSNPTNEVLYGELPAIIMHRIKILQVNVKVSVIGNVLFFFL